MSRTAAVAAALLLALTLTACGSEGCTTGCIQTQSGSAAYAYVVAHSTLNTYSISPATGGLAALVGSPLALPAADGIASEGVVQIATDPSGRFLYLLDQTGGVYAYAVDRNTGALSQVPGSPFASPSGPTSFAFDASGTHLYVAGETGPVAPVDTVISAYSVDGSSGALTQLADYTIAGESSTIATAGSHLYVAGFYADSITVFSIGSSGELTEDVAGSPFAIGGQPYNIVVDSSGSALYTANTGAPTATAAAPGSISAFTIDSSTGALTPVNGSPWPIPAQGPVSIDPMGRFLFVPEADGVSVYAINAGTGVLSEVPGSPFAAGTDPRSVSVDSTNKIVYVANTGSANVSEFRLGSTGALTPLGGAPVPVGTSPCCMAIVWK